MFYIFDSDTGKNIDYIFRHLPNLNVSRASIKRNYYVDVHIWIFIESELNSVMGSGSILNVLSVA